MVDGLTLDQWLATSFDHEDGTFRSTITPEFNHALQKFGTNALPRLLSRLQTRRLPGERVIAKWAAATPNPQAFATAVGLNRWYIEGQRGINGLQALGSLATNAIPEILAMEPSLFTMRALADMGYSAIPILHDATRNGSDQIKSHAMSAFESSDFDFSREKIVEIWVERLTDPSPSIRLHAARLLGKTKPVRAQAAIEPLRKLANDPNPEVAAAASNALSTLELRR